MKKLFLPCLIALSIFASCKKDDISARTFSPNDTTDVSIDDETAHSTVVISNNGGSDVVIEKVSTGTNTDIGGAFPISSGTSIEIKSTNLGNTNFFITLSHSINQGSINVIDSEGVVHSRSLAGGDYELIAFENISVSASRPIYLQLIVRSND